MEIFEVLGSMSTKSTVAPQYKAQLADAITLTVAPMLVGGYKAVNTLTNDSIFPRIVALNSHQQDDEIIVWGEIDYKN